MIPVLLESPYAGDAQRILYNVRYARACMADSLRRGEAPYASHLLYTQDGILRDGVPEERAQGIEAGLLWGKFAEKSVVYIDMGISEGMKQGIARAEAEGRPVEERKLGRNGLATLFGADVCEATGKHWPCGGCSRCKDCEYCKCHKRR